MFNEERVRELIRQEIELDKRFTKLNILEDELEVRKSRLNKYELKLENIDEEIKEKNEEVKRRFEMLNIRRKSMYDGCIEYRDVYDSRDEYDKLYNKTWKFKNEVDNFETNGKKYYEATIVECKEKVKEQEILVNEQNIIIRRIKKLYNINERD